MEDSFFINEVIFGQDLALRQWITVQSLHKADMLLGDVHHRDFLDVNLPHPVSFPEKPPAWHQYFTLDALLPFFNDKAIFDSWIISNFCEDHADLSSGNRNHGSKEINDCDDSYSNG